MLSGSPPRSVYVTFNNRFLNNAPGILRTAPARRNAFDVHRRASLNKGYMSGPVVTVTVTCMHASLRNLIGLNGATVERLHVRPNAQMTVLTVMSSAKDF